jgi:hypothetical protein
MPLLWSQLAEPGEAAWDIEPARFNVRF